MDYQRVSIKCSHLKDQLRVLRKVLDMLKQSIQTWRNKCFRCFYTHATSPRTFSSACVRLEAHCLQNITRFPVANHRKSSQNPILNQFFRFLTILKKSKIQMSLGGIKNPKFEKKSWESTENRLKFSNFNFYQNRLRISKVRADSSWGGGTRAKKDTGFHRFSYH